MAQSHVKLCEQKKKEKARKKKEAKEAKAALAKGKEKAEKEKKAQEAANDPASASKPTEDGASPSVAGDEKTKIGKKSAGKAAPDGPKTTKKRKADGDGDKEPKKKKLKKDEPPKPKLPKPKGPVDVEKQCGVLLPNGGYCARSLTCKSHSMGAKRAVPGRSLPYDILLASYQKKNQAKQQSKLSFFPITTRTHFPLSLLEHILPLHTGTSATGGSSENGPELQEIDGQGSKNHHTSLRRHVPCFYDLACSKYGPAQARKAGSNGQTPSPPRSAAVHDDSCSSASE